MLEYQKRVVEERDLLYEKIERLESFISSDQFNEIDEYQQCLLTKQYDAMFTYAGILDERIHDFVE